MTYPDAPSRSRLLRGSAALSCVGLVLALAACGASADALSVAGGIGGDSSTGGSLGTLTGGGTGGAAVGMPLQAVEIAVGTAHTCARIAGGEVACWGDGTYG